MKSEGKVKSVPVIAGSGGGAYPEKDIGKAGVMVKGRWPSGTGMKSYSTMRGAGAATKGKKFLKD
jgi:hypothetical protein